jgi:transposase-like protein
MKKQKSVLSELSAEDEALLSQLPADFFKRFKTMQDINGFMDKLFKRGVEKMLESELSEHLGYDKHSVEGNGSGNSRNGKTRKLVKSSSGEIIIEVPRDRQGDFNPIVLPKRQKVIDKIESVVISLYARGMSTRDIEDQIKDIYGVTISASSISNITDQVMSDVEAWQTRPLDDTYLIVWLDGIRIKVRSEGKIICKSVYLIIGLNTNGHREVISMWINETESASFWMNVLDDLKKRGVKDILIACSDNLKGLTQAIKAVFPEAVTQLCIVHQIRNTMNYIASKEKRVFMKDLQQVYQARNLETAQEAFAELDTKWGDKYPYAIKSWIANWENLTAYFEYPLEIRKIIYTTNVIENLNRNIRKFTKNRLMFPDDQAMKKAVYLAIQQASVAWSTKVQNWPLIASQFMILYPDRANISENSLRIK